MSSLEMVRKALAGKPVHEIEAFLRQHLTHAEACAVLKQVEAATPKIDVHDERALKLAEAGDPEKALFELLGYKLTSDVRKLLYEMIEQPAVMGAGGNNTSKTFISSALELVWFFHVQAVVRDENGRPKGCIIGIVAPTRQSVVNTAYKDYRIHAQRALDHSGHKIPGYENSSDRTVNWQVADDWKMVGINPSTKTGDDAVLHAVSGLHHAHMLLLHVEEALGLKRKIFSSLDGLNPHKIFMMFNPTTSQTPVHSLATGGEYSVVHLSALNHPNVLRRDPTIIPGGMTAVAVERRMRLDGQVRRLGLASEVIPDRDKNDFIYALPDRGTEDRPGPREDGVPGHPDAEPVVFRPSPWFCGQILGAWPTGASSGLFDLAEWLAAVRDWHSRVIPTSPPRIVGVDTAGLGPDPVVCVPCWGLSARDLLHAKIEAETSNQPVDGWNHKASLPACNHSISGCLICGDEGFTRTVLGEPVSAPKDDHETTARWVVERWGTTPVYHLDGSHGQGVHEWLTRLGATSHLVSFGGSPDEPLEGQPEFMNKRASMWFNFSRAVNNGLLSLPPSERLRADAFAQRVKEGEVARRGEGKMPVLCLAPKEEISRNLGRSPDEGDATVLALADVVPPWVGGQTWAPTTW